jgi:ABC-type transport system involved in multi-copper enzyme maturation permease subunit
MIALLKKDWHVQRVAVIGTIIMTLLPYIILVGVSSMDEEHFARPDYFVSGASCALWLVTILGSVFGGAAFAQERRERSADFLAMMPTSRARIVLSKSIVGIGAVAILWLIHFAVLMLALHTYAQRYGKAGTLAAAGLREPVLESIAAALMIFGIAWLMSTFLSSPSISAVVGLAAMLATMMTLRLIEHSMLLRDEMARIAPWLICGILGISGVIAFIAGTIYYLLRVEP